MSHSLKVGALVPILLKPQLLTFKNRWCSRRPYCDPLGRRLTVATLAFIIISAVYVAAQGMLQALAQIDTLAGIPPALPLGLFLLLLSGLLFFSNLVSALSSLYFSADNERLLAAPLRPATLFWSRLLELIGSSAWLLFVFGLPLWVAFGQVWGLGYQYYLLSLVAIIPFLILPAAGALVAVILGSALIPLQHVRLLLLTLLLATALLAAGMLQGLPLTGTGIQAGIPIEQSMALLEKANHYWLPSTWLAVALAALAESQPLLYMFATLVIYAAALSAMLAAFLLLTYLYPRIYSRTCSSKGPSLPSRRAQGLARCFTPFLSAPARAVVFKDLKSFTRDMTQAVQLMLLLAICLVYLSNLKLMHAAERLPAGGGIWWDLMLLLLNIGMAGFVMAAVAARFVFPSMSLEGPAYWILHSSPLELRRLLWIKFGFWYCLLAGMFTIIISSGALAINAGPFYISVSICFGWLICLGITGMGIGLGSLFARFDWENAAQLSSNLGSLLYLLACFALIVINLFMGLVVLVFGTLKSLEGGLGHLNWLIFLIGALLLLLWLNAAALRWSFNLGLGELRQRS